MRLLTLILGIHRSGTSLLTHGLISAGADAGNFEDVRDANNPDGYAEHPDIRIFNDKLLTHLGASWDNWGFRYSKLDLSSAELPEWRDEAADLLRLNFQGPGPFVLKDPRIASLASFWDGVALHAGFTLRRVIIVRDPAEVAASQLLRTQRFPNHTSVIADHESMAALWAVTMYELLTSLTDDNTILVSHTRLLNNSAQVFAYTSQFAGLTPADGVINDFCDEKIKRSLYRARAAPACPGPWMSVARAFYWSLIANGCCRNLPADEANAIAKSQPGLQAMLPSLGAVRNTITAMQRAQVESLTQLQAINMAIWQISSLTGNATREQISDAIDSILRIPGISALQRHSFSYGYCVARLLILADRREELRDWLQTMRPYFGHLAPFTDLESYLV